MAGNGKGDSSGHIIVRERLTFCWTSFGDDDDDTFGEGAMQMRVKFNASMLEEMEARQSQLSKSRKYPKYDGMDMLNSCQNKLPT